jgi:uncharacterized protein YegP (UPF0339 family)
MAEEQNISKPEIKSLPRSNIETIDGAFFNHIDEKLNLHCTTAEGFKKVPVIWQNSERAFQIKNNIQIRDANGSLIPPIISVNRKSISKDLAKKGAFQANLAPNNNRVIFTQELNQEKTSNFANADSLKKTGQVNFVTSKKNKKQVYKFKSVLMPVYVMIDYEVQIMTNYLQQMNELIQPFMTKTAAINYFVIRHESFTYECFIQQDFNQETENLSEEERKYKATVTIKVLGQLVGDDVNQDIPTIKEEENAVEIKIPKENIIIETEEGARKRTVSNANMAPELVSAGAVSKKTYLVGDGVNSVYTVTHNFNSRDIYVSVRQSSGNYEQVFVGVSFVNANSISINFGGVIGNGSHFVTIIS